MELKYLNTFRTIVETGSFTAAAKRLNYTQSAITFQMSQLEQELHTTLFEKVGRKMILTVSGKKLIPYVEEVFQSVDSLYSFDDSENLYRGELRVGVAETVLSYKLPKSLKKFVGEAPNAKLYLQSMNCYDIRDALLNGTLDVGIFYENVGGFGSNFITHSLGDFPVVLVASPKTKKLYSDFVSPDRAVPIPLIINEPNCIFRQIFEKYLKEKSILLNPTIEMGSIHTIKNLVMNDVGISFLPKFTVEEELESGKMMEIPITVEENSIRAVCAYHKNKSLNPLMQLFVDCCTKK